MHRSSLRRLAALTGLVFLANTLGLPVHAIGMLESAAAPAMPEECPMHQPHQVSGGDDACVCPGGDCSVSGTDRPVIDVAGSALISVVPRNLRVTVRDDEIPDQSSPAGYSSRGPPLFSLY